jgi:hypothetical protein
MLEPSFSIGKWLQNQKGQKRRLTSPLADAGLFPEALRRLRKGGRRIEER